MPEQGHSPGVTLRMGVGAPGKPPGAGVYSGTPTQVKSNASRGSPSYVQTRLSFGLQEIELAAEPVGFAVHAVLDGELISHLQPVDS